jgi:hypothetical protein
MLRPYSMDLREWVIDAVKTAHATRNRRTVWAEPDRRD